MTKKKKPSARAAQRRFARRATRRGGAPKDKERLRPLLLIAGIAVVAVVAALIWGGILKARSDAYRASLEAGEWTLDEETAVAVPVDGPHASAVWVAPNGTVPAGYDGVVLTLGNGTDALTYDMEVALSMGLTVAEDAPALSHEIRRFHGEGMEITGVVEITSHRESDPALQAYRQGVELALLCAYAGAGVDHLLLTGLPVGSDRDDATAVACLKQVQGALSDMDNRPSVGIILSPEAVGLTGGTGGDAPTYTGSLTPGRMLTACDFLALDVRSVGDGADAILRALSYPYVRYSLTLLVADEATATLANTRGFDRLTVWGNGSP